MWKAKKGGEKQESVKRVGIGKKRFYYYKYFHLKLYRKYWFGLWNHTYYFKIENDIRFYIISIPFWKNYTCTKDHMHNFRIGHSSCTAQLIPFWLSFNIFLVLSSIPLKHRQTDTHTETHTPESSTSTALIKES